MMKISKKAIGFILIFSLIMFSFHFAKGQEFMPNEKIILKAFPAEDAKTIVVLIANLINRKTSVIICDKQGWVVFKMTLKNEIGFARRLNLSRLTGKEYSISVIQKGVKFTQFFYMSENGPKMGNLEKYCFGRRTIIKLAPGSGITAQLESDYK